jgi:hypothetical protein
MWAQVSGLEGLGREIFAGRQVILQTGDQLFAQDAHNILAVNLTLFGIIDTVCAFRGIRSVIPEYPVT